MVIQEALRNLEMPRFARRYPAILNTLIKQMMGLVAVRCCLHPLLVFYRFFLHCLLCFGLTCIHQAADGPRGGAFFFLQFLHSFLLVLVRQCSSQHPCQAADGPLPAFLSLHVLHSYYAVYSERE